ncbi:restriction endonuclease subunit S [Olsenella uli]|uniref:restriction endonuclease subunit S n=1 Tax=Olsenella uli TaxID=133926 RepID=UPI00325FBDCA
MVAPAGWESRPIGDFLDFKNGLNKGKEYFGYGTPIVNYMDVYQHNGLHADDIQGRVSLDREEIRRFAVRKGDVFFTRTSETPDEVGMASVLLDDLPEGVFSGFVLRGRPKTGELLPEYCKYCFSTQNVREAIVKSCTYTTRALTNGSVLSRIEILAPPVGEQYQIATALGDLENLLSSLAALRDKQKSIRMGLVNRLLMGVDRLPSHHGVWRDFSLGGLGAFRKGSGISRSEVGTGPLPCIRYGEIYTSYNAYTFETITRVSSDIAAKATKIARGDIVFACTGETKEDIGKCVAYMSNQVGYAGGDTQILTPKAGIDPVFLSLLLNSDEVQRQKSARGQGDAVVHISGDSLMAVQLRLPPYDEQQAISRVAMDLDNEIAATERKLEKYGQIRQGMMRELLTGHIRLVQE